MCDLDRGMAGQRGGMDGASIALLEAGAAMCAASMDLVRPAVGEEMATRAGRAARAAYLAIVDAEHPDTIGGWAPAIQAVVHQAYCTEWARLANTPEEGWHR